MQQTLTLTNRVHLPLEAHGVSQGVPWPQGALRDETSLRARDESGRLLPMAARTLNRWPDGSAQWTLLDLSLDIEPSATRVIVIETGHEDEPVPQPAFAVHVSEDEQGIVLGNGKTSLKVTRGAGSSLSVGWEAGDIDALIVDGRDVIYSAAHDPDRRVRVEHTNALRAVVRVEGKHRSTHGATLLDYWIRFTLRAGQADVQVTYHYHNMERIEPGVEIRSMTLELRTRLPVGAERAIMHAFRGRQTRPEPYRLPEDFEICSSNTMDLDSYPQTHRGLTGGGMGRVFMRPRQWLRDDPLLKPWFVRQVVDFKFQSQDTPEAYVWSYLGLVSDEGSLVVAGGNMVGLHPKSLAVADNVVRYAIWPPWAGMMDITQGEGRTLDFFVGLLPPRATDMQIIQRYLSWELSSLYAHWGAQGSVEVSMDIEHVRGCRVFQVDKLPAYEPRKRLAFERKVKAQWAPDGATPATGHWHYGDLFARWDIGANNEEMVGHVWFQEYLRTGRPVCLERGMAQARHIADVDICAFSADPYQNGGMCSHGPRHNHSAAYPSHMWFTELFMAYALSGDEEYRKAGLRVCDNLVFWINDPMGMENVCADGREAGQPLINLAWAYPFAPEARYLAAMRKVVREAFMDRVARHGSLVYMKPRESLPLVRFPSYGEWAAWEGLYCVWELTQDEELRRFLLGQLEWRLQEERMNTQGTFRDTDFNVAAYAYYMSSDGQWLDRVARPFQAAFRGVQWPFGYIKSMYYLHLALERGIVSDEQVLLS